MGDQYLITHDSACTYIEQTLVALKPNNKDQHLVEKYEDPGAGPPLENTGLPLDILVVVLCGSVLTG